MASTVAMRLSTMILVLLAHPIGLSLSTPLPASLSPRTQYCANAPSTVAGTFLPRDLLAPAVPALPLSVRSSLPTREPSTILWCAPHGRTYIILTLTTAPIPTLATLLRSASQYVATHIHELGDAVIARGKFEMGGPGGLVLRTWNANNHQQTWGTLSGAVDALRDYMLTHGFAGGRFGIFDGENLVGEGVLGGA